MTLRTSQLETLRAVRRFEGRQPEIEVEPHDGASPAQIAGVVDRKRPSVEATLERLSELGLVEPIEHPEVSDSYRLTPAGEEELRRAE